MTPIPGSTSLRGYYPDQAFRNLRIWKAVQPYYEINAYVFFEVNRFSAPINLQF